MSFDKRYLSCRWTLSLGAAIVCLACLPSASRAQFRLREVCRVKGQEENYLHGLGLVVGLKGTGDSKATPTLRTLSTYMNLLGNPLSQGPANQPNLDDLKGNTQNVALVFVTATVPATGARQGDQLDCTVDALGAKSLEGGRLMLTALIGPRPGSKRVYAFAQGALHLNDPNKSASATIHGGCTLEENFVNEFIKDGKFTLVLKESHGGFEMANGIAEVINDQSQIYFTSPESARVQASIQDNPGVAKVRTVAGGNQAHAGNGDSFGDEVEYIAKAIDSKTVEVIIPDPYANSTVEFIAQVLNQPYHDPQREARVYINERVGSILIDGNVEIGAVAVSHKGMAIETGGAVLGQFAPIDVGKKSTTKLQALISALNAVNASPHDQIDIIKGLHKSGNLYAKLILEGG